MLSLRERLSPSENGNLEGISDDSKKVLDNSGCRTDPRTPEGRQRLLEARKNAPRKSFYVRAIMLHCRHCFGVIPVRTDCEAHTLQDGTSCNLYPYNTAEKCRKSTKTSLKRAIGRECRYCGGEGGTCGKCNLYLREENAPLYGEHARAGSAVDHRQTENEWTSP